MFLFWQGPPGPVGSKGTLGVPGEKVHLCSWVNHESFLSFESTWNEIGYWGHTFIEACKGCTTLPVLAKEGARWEGGVQFSYQIHFWIWKGNYKNKYKIETKWGSNNMIVKLSSNTIHLCAPVSLKIMLHSVGQTRWCWSSRNNRRNR